MKAISISKSQCRRQFTGLIRKIESGKLDKASIYENGVRVAVLLSPDVMNNPLENSFHELRESYGKE